MDNEYTYEDGDCILTYDEELTYKNSADIVRVVLNEDMMISGFEDAVCCNQSADDADDPLILACRDDGGSDTQSYTY